MELRRRAPRFATGGWPGQCRVEDDPESSWTECSVLDISLLGVGVEVLSEAPGDIVGQQLVVQVVPPLGHAISLQLLGIVRNQHPLSDGRTRVGLEFADLSDTERSILSVFEQLKICW